MLEISPAVARDMEKAKEGKIPAPPIEAFMSDDMASKIESASKLPTQPVHAETLRPITRGEANRRTTITGNTLPSMPAPRRVIPAPFQRPTVNGGTHGKSWQNVRAGQVAAGDIIPEVGLVFSTHELLERETVAEVDGVPTRVSIVVTSISGDRHKFAPEHQLRVFRKSV
jgi:hypothetical protein